MKYQSELIKEIVDTRGHKESSLHYESECVETWIKEAKGAYPKLCDYESEWLKYISILDDTGGSEKPEPPIEPEPEEPPIGKFPYVALSDVTEATIDNVVPYAYKSAILRGNTLVNVVSEQGFGGNKTVYESRFFDSPFNTGETFTIFVVNPNVTTIKVGLHHPTTGNWQREIQYNVSDNKRVVYTVPAGSICKYVAVVVRTANDATGFENSLVIVSGDKSNLEIDKYFDGVQSVQTPVLTTSNEDGTKSNILTVNENVVLRGIGDVKDELDLLTGEVAQRVGKTTITGDLLPNVFSSERNNNSETMCFESFGNIIPFQWNQIISGEWSITRDEYNPALTKEYFNPRGGYGVFRIKRSRLETEDVKGFKKWLNENPITIYHPVIGSESVKTVELNIQDQNGKTLSVIKPIEGTMHIKTSGTPIPPTAVLEVPVEAITQNLASFIDLD